MNQDNEDPVGFRSGMIVNTYQVWTRYGFLERRARQPVYQGTGVTLYPGDYVEVAIRRWDGGLEARRVSPIDYTDPETLYDFEGGLAFNKNISTTRPHMLNGDVFYEIPTIGYVLGNNLPPNTKSVHVRLVTLHRPFPLMAEFVCGWEAMERVVERVPPKASKLNPNAPAFVPGRSSTPRVSQALLDFINKF